MNGDRAVSPVPGKPNLLLGAYEPETLGYRAEEFFVSGTASSYAADEQADYTTRIVVLTPKDDAAFNGTVIVEWLNVSGGIDAPAVWFMAHREIARAGYAYVAVSAQRVGVEGGESLVGADMSLKAQDPDRVFAAQPSGRRASPTTSTPRSVVWSGDGALDGLNPEAVLAVGESQSAMFLTTYVNDVDPLAGGLRRLPGPFTIRARGAAGRNQRARGSRRIQAAPFRGRPAGPGHHGHHRNRPGRRPRVRLSPARRPDSDTSGRGRSPAPPTRTTTRSGSASSTPDPRRCDDIVAAYAPTERADGYAVVVLHQFRPTAPLRPAGSHREAEHLGSNRRTRTERATDRLDRSGPAAARPRREWACRGRCPHPVGRRPDRADVGHRHPTRAPCRSSSAPASCSTPRR